MPQPYHGDKQLIFGAVAMMQRPELGARIAAIATIWTLVEDTWGAILGMMVGVQQAEASMEMFHALTGTASQRSLLDKMASQYLPEALKKDYADLIKIGRRRAIERNEVVHGLWFYDPKDPDALVLGPRNVFSQMFKTTFAAIRDGRPLPVKTLNLSRATDGRWMIYRAKDFDNIAVRVLEFGRDLDHLFDCLTIARGYPTFGPPARPAE